MTKAVKNIEEKIAPALKGMNPTDQESIDKKMIELDGTANKCGPPPPFPGPRGVAGVRGRLRSEARVLTGVALLRSNLGANAILAVSLAVAKAGAAQKGVPLYKHFADLAGVKKMVPPPSPPPPLVPSGHAASLTPY